MSDAEKKGIKAGNEDWENELWSLINSSDGTNCPLYKSCEYRKHNKDCLSRNTAYTNAIHKFLDEDSLNFPLSYKECPSAPMCVVYSQIFKLVKKLAQSYSDKAGVETIPVSTKIIKSVSFDQPIEVRLVPLKSAHGAVWQLNRDGWVIHLNSKDPPARRRFTLFHELFHILAHCNASPVFKKIPCQKEGSFNELLADHFSAVMLMPENQVRKRWVEVKDIRRMAVIFDVPEPVMYCGLKHLRLI